MLFIDIVLYYIILLVHVDQTYVMSIGNEGYVKGRVINIYNTGSLLDAVYVYQIVN